MIRRRASWLKLLSRRIGYKLQTRGWHRLAEVFHKMADE